ncbi:TetR family transcriptional regulator [Rhizobium sp. TH135]|uniref:TetR/AcrR family transcriptional regulator n=1 Tax=Rhizobium sp. TH135 TaxID=2067451 RepID=UPI000C7CB911|nr:TetR/AcrR family transcriptional regulator [Rhizobium sp. TH135]PLK73136.1 TetR family transcriptional regulator [Rhizobium sp. TH135]
MPRSQKQKAQSREAIIRSAAKLFRERGIDGVTVAEIMEGAGLTHGGFPRHFSSKDELVKEALADVFEANARAPFLPAKDLQTLAKAYLSSSHRNAPGSGCVFAALGTEMARSSAPTRNMLTQAIADQIEDFTHKAGAGDPERKRIEAIGTWATMIGAMMLARIVDSPDLAEDILSSARAHIEDRPGLRQNA